MALNAKTARLAKLFVEDGVTSFFDAQARLDCLKLEIFVGDDADTPAGHAAALTAVSVAHRTFVGGVRVRGALDKNLNSALSFRGSLGKALANLGAAEFDGKPLFRVRVGTGGIQGDMPTFSTWWDGWSAGVYEAHPRDVGDATNPLAGNVAGAMAVGTAFQAFRQNQAGLPADVHMWGEGIDSPTFSEVFLPRSLWFVGLGNLGQAMLWSLASLPYEDPNDVSLVLQDFDHVTEENWGTSVLVREKAYGVLKTKMAEQWAEARGFKVRRVDRPLFATDRLIERDPGIALSGVDKVDARKRIGQVGFDCVIDAGLGRSVQDFDKYRVSVFDQFHSIEKHFSDQTDSPPLMNIPNQSAYRQLASEIGQCGALAVAGSNVAVPYVSAVAAAIAVSRAISIVSGTPCPRSEVRQLSAQHARRLSSRVRIHAPNALHAGRARTRTDSSQQS